LPARAVQLGQVVARISPARALAQPVGALNDPGLAVPAVYEMAESKRKPQPTHVRAIDDNARGNENKSLKRQVDNARAYVKQAINREEKR